MGRCLLLSGDVLPPLLLLVEPPLPHATGRTSDRLFAAIQLGNASLALAAAEKMNGRLPAAESALRHGVTELRWVLGAGATDLQRLSSSRVEVRGVLLVCSLCPWGRGGGLLRLSLVTWQ
jgi:hypothetical protein